MVGPGSRTGTGLGDHGVATLCDYLGDLCLPCHCGCSATTIRDRRDEWIRLGIFARLKQIALESYERIVGLVLDQIAVDGSITKTPGGGAIAGRSR